MPRYVCCQWWVKNPEKHFLLYSNSRKHFYLKKKIFNFFKKKKSHGNFTRITSLQIGWALKSQVPIKAASNPYSLQFRFNDSKCNSLSLHLKVSCQI